MDRAEIGDVIGRRGGGEECIRMPRGEGRSRRMHRAAVADAFGCRRGWQAKPTRCSARIHFRMPRGGKRDPEMYGAAVAADVLGLSPGVTSESEDVSRGYARISRGSWASPKDTSRGYAFVVCHAVDRRVRRIHRARTDAFIYHAMGEGGISESERIHHATVRDAIGCSVAEREPERIHRAAATDASRCSEVASEFGRIHRAAATEASRCSEVASEFGRIHAPRSGM